MNNALIAFIVLILFLGFWGLIIYAVITAPKWMGNRIKRERERRAYYDSPYEPGDPPWRRQVPPWTNEGFDEQPRPVHQHPHHPEHQHQHHQAPGVSHPPAPQHPHHAPGGSSPPEPHHHSSPSDPPPMHHHS